MRKYIRKADIILFIVLVLAGLAASAVLAVSRTGGDKVVIESGGKLYATYSLFEDRTIEVPATRSQDLPGEQTAQDTGEADDSSGKSAASGSHGTGEYNIVVIQDGEVSVTEASCKNQVCVRHHSISKSGESIICLPNRLVVRIEGSGQEGGGYDSVTS